MTVPGVQADIEVEQSAISQPLEHRGDLVTKLLVGHRMAEAGQPGGGRVGPVLHAGESGLADRVGVTVAVEEPVMALPAGDELLQHQSGLGLLTQPVDAVELLLAGHYRRAVQATACGPRRRELRDQRIADLGGELARVAGRLGNAGPRTGHAELEADLVQRVLAGQLAGQVLRWRGNRNQSRRSRPCSARKIAPASSVVISTEGRPMRSASRSRPATTRSASAGSGCQKQRPARYRELAAGAQGPSCTP